MKLIKFALIVTVYLIVPSKLLAELPAESKNISSNDQKLIDAQNCCISICHYPEEFFNKSDERENKNYIIKDIQRTKPIVRSQILWPLPDTDITSKPTETAIKTATECKLGAGKVVTPRYAFYLIGFIILFLIVVIIILGVLLYRTKLHEYKVIRTQTTPNTTLNVDIARKYITQSSQEMSLLNINSDTKSDTMSIVPRDSESNDIPDSKTLPKNPLKIYKSVRKPVDHQMLLREQMKKICEDALVKSQNCGLTASLKDLNKLLNEFDNEKHQNSHESIVREKSASYPQLDIYDEPLARKNPVNDNEVDIPVYDCLPSSNNVIVRDYETNYLMALSNENDTEPAYINAKIRYQN